MSENNKAIEVLRELVRVRAYGSFTTIKGTYSSFEVGDALKKALLALERLDEIRIDLKLIKQNIEEDNYVNLKQQVIDDLNEVINYD